MAILKILTAPDYNLTKKSKNIDFVDDKIRIFLNDMLDTMYHDKGVGLAANQVGILKRILVIDLKNDDDQKRSKDFYPLFVINPKITKYSDNMIEAEERCLSVPEQKISVIRPEKITVNFLDYDNNQQEITISGWLARVFQHEMDHLDGKLIIDYLSNLKKSVTLRKLTKIQKLSN